MQPQIYELLARVSADGEIFNFNFCERIRITLRNCCCHDLLDSSILLNPFFCESPCAADFFPFVLFLFLDSISNYACRWDLFTWHVLLLIFVKTFFFCLLFWWICSFTWLPVFPFEGITLRACKLNSFSFFFSWWYWPPTCTTWTAFLGCVFQVYDMSWYQIICLAMSFFLIDQKKKKEGNA